MPPKKSRKEVTPDDRFAIWNGLTGSAACLIVFLVPFFPDEKLVRLKMEALELGIFVLLGLIGLRFFLTGSLPFLRLHTEDGRVENNLRRPVVVLTCVVVCWVLVQAILALVSDEKSLASNELRRVFLGGAAFLAFAWTGFSSAWQRRILLMWSLAAGLLALYGCLQVSGGIGRIQVPQMDRVMGTYGNPIFFAAFLVPSIFMTLAFFFVAGRPGWKLLAFVFLLLQCAALYFTKTRGAWLGFAAALGAWILLHFRSGSFRSFPKWILLLFLAGAGLFAYQTRSTWTRDQGHLLIWRDTVRMWGDHPVSGVGLGAFHTVFPSYAQDDLKSKWPKGQFIVNYAHNEYLQTLAEGGVLGLGSFAAVILSFFVFVGFHLQKGTEKSRDPLVLFPSLAVFSLLVQNMFSVDMRFGVSLASIFMLMGWAASRLTSAEPEWKSLGLFAGAPSVGASPNDQTWPVPVRWVGGSLWMILMGFIVLPLILKPYQAQKTVSATPGFFDERLLDPAKSIQDLEKLAGEYPEEPAILDKLAFVYAKEMKTSDNKINVRMANSAIAAYESLIRLDPQRAGAYNNLANIHYTMGHSDQAIELWRKCVAVEPGFKDAHLNLGKTLYVRGDLKESASHLETVLKLEPGNPEAIVYLKRMVQ